MLGAGADDHLVAVDADVFSSFNRPMSMIISGVARRSFMTGSSEWLLASSGGVLAVLGEQRQRAVQRVRAGVGEADGDHESLPVEKPGALDRPPDGAVSVSSSCTLPAS